MCGIKWEIRFGRPTDQGFLRKKRGFLVNLMKPVLHPAHGFVSNELPRVGCFAPLAVSALPEPWAHP